MDHCETCRFFSQLNDDNKLIYGTDFGKCSSELFSEDIPVPEKALFIYTDYEGYKAYFYVHKHFGCIGHKRKPGPKGYHDVEEFYPE